MTSTPSTPCTRPSPSTTAPSWTGLRSRSLSASRRDSSLRTVRTGWRSPPRSHATGRPASSRTSAKGRPLSTGRSSTSPTRVSARRLSARSAPTKSSTNVVGGRHQQLRRRRVLGQHAALLEHRDAVAQLDRLVDVVGDEDDRLADALLQAQELVLQALAVDRVDGAERLVHEHQRRVGGQGARHAHALALAAGELRGVAVARLGRVEADELDAARRRARGCARAASPAPAGRWRCCRRSSGAGTGRSAGSRSRSRGAARRAARAHRHAAERMSPLVISIMRLTRRMAVVLPQPDGPDEDADLAGRDLEAQVLDRRLVRPLVGLGDVAELEGRRLRVRRRPLGLGGGGVFTEEVPGGGSDGSERCRAGYPVAGQTPAAAARVGVRGVLERVVERRQRLVEPERRGDQPVGEPRVLGQQRAVEVGADHVCRARTPSKPERARVAVARAARGRAAAAPAPRCVRPPWFSKPARTRGRQARQLDLDGDVADQSRAVARARCAGRRARRPGSRSSPSS